MFDIGFSELLLIALVTLLVMGPERLPQTVRSISLWIGRLKQMLASARRDLEQEVGMDDIRQQLHNEQVMRELNESKEHLEETYSKAFDNNLGEDMVSSLENQPLPHNHRSGATFLNSVQFFFFYVAVR